MKQPKGSRKKLIESKKKVKDRRENIQFYASKYLPVKVINTN